MGLPVQGFGQEGAHRRPTDVFANTAFSWSEYRSQSLHTRSDSNGRHGRFRYATDSYRFSDVRLRLRLFSKLAGGRETMASQYNDADLLVSPTRL